MGEWERGAWPGGSGQCVCRIWAVWGSNRETAAAWENGRERERERERGKLQNETHLLPPASRLQKNKGKNKNKE
ncbi:unnamed protein product [Prunus armeniaca]|uniref:Uncharacterized protein n=1 Tax=Prunus armeniaca TaxID=36596 RepID=A0A6J5W1E2_PRUAR|nr:unnamed protein product [Prunus armeniaca]